MRVSIKIIFVIGLSGLSKNIAPYSNSINFKNIKIPKIIEIIFFILTTPSLCLVSFDKEYSSLLIRVTKNYKIFQVIYYNIKTGLVMYNHND